MGNFFYCISMLCCFLVSGTVFAQQAGERDPFYPDRRPAASVPSPAADWGKDPFSNPFGTKATGRPREVRRSQSRNLTGIIYSRDVRLAIVNGETVREGGMVGDQRVAAIRTRSIVLKAPGGGAEEIFLDEFSIRK